ncbi:ATP-binding protein [Ureibacillus aquaedulcis]|uniref:ATP-binding protein n=1 Tax=Ureibacillus aquaedulcis TaxID=3058421 RepID=A0ABT8GMW8_9BACL|nr:ATP-binding protein [Ureibacillus sp. BA0131]MDN4492646.1 ATP-binding protein [Ureibacillus sp. BA0131]
MIVHSLSGPSGTGKSTSAIQFAYENQIEAIIDDGLLIIHGEKVAGTSAKFEKNTITAVRRAIFQEQQHQLQVMDALKEHEVQSILIIGTSDKMTKKIAKRLQLEPIQYFHHIEQIRSTREILMAKFIRTTQGKHVMPIPYKQVEQNFFKRFIYRGFDIFSKNKVKLGETTIVQPDFHQQIIDISKNVYIDLIKYLIGQYKVVAKIDSIHFVMKDYRQILYLTLYLSPPVNYDVVEKMGGLQQLISEQFLRHFEFEPSSIEIYIKGIAEK